MFRKIVGFALLAVAAGFVLKFALGLLGFVVGLAVTTVCLAAVGYGGYLVLRLVSPGAAATVRGLIGGPDDAARPPNPPPR